MRVYPIDVLSAWLEVIAHGYPLTDVVLVLIAGRLSPAVAR
jgi:hypothetical protein